jgi:protein O-GlcNAc transferase
LHELKRPEEALASYDQAVALRPSYAEALANRGTALLDLKRHDEARESYARALRLDPEQEYLKGMHLHAKMLVCDWTDFDRECAQLGAAVAGGAAAALPFHLLSCPSSLAIQLQCAGLYLERKYPTSLDRLWRGEPYAHPRIRLAYLSSDLGDRDRFETTAISFGPDTPSAMRARLKGAFDRFIDARSLSDADVARLMRDLEIDIAIDLNGFTDGLRPDILAGRPAPIQVSYLGYAGTMGGPHWDYILADRFVIPEESKQYFAEQVVYLPDSFMVNDAGRKISVRAPSRAEEGLPERGFVFCCLNNTYKITPDVFDVWMRMLDKTEGSVLWLSASNASAVANLRREAEVRGVAADRLIFARKVPLNEDHLARIRLADLFVDTLYYNAHTTAADALWGGVPVLTCAGTTFASRVAGSLLGALGLPELIACSLADYEALALRLAGDPALMVSLRQKLARNRETFPLFNTDRFARHLELAYTAMRQRVQDGERPRSFAVAPIP